MLSVLLLSTVGLQVSSTSVAKIPVAVILDDTFGMCIVQPRVVIPNSDFR